MQQPRATLTEAQGRSADRAQYRAARKQAIAYAATPNRSRFPWEGTLYTVPVVAGRKSERRLAGFLTFRVWGAA